MSREEMIALFLDNAGKAAAGVSRATGTTELPRALSEIVPKSAAVYCPDVTALEKAVVGLFKHHVPDYAKADVTVEEVLGGIAETGSIVCTSTGGRAVQASLLPAHHVAILPVDKIYPTLEEFFASLSAAPPTNIAIITGPSRTADIELTLAIGVHGPERLDIIVI